MVGAPTSGKELRTEAGKVQQILHNTLHRPLPPCLSCDMRDGGRNWDMNFDPTN